MPTCQEYKDFDLNDDNMCTCRNCEADYSEDFDHNDDGWWCEYCDTYNYFDSQKHDEHHFTLLLEQNLKMEMPRLTNKKLKQHISPFRYPGGKSRLIPYLANYLKPTKSKILASPFAGGASFELSMLEAGLVDKLILNDIDYGVYSVWWCILYMPDALIERIERFQPTHKAFYAAQALIKSDYKHLDMLDAAWNTLLVNRLAYSGIVKANPLGGKNGSTEDLTSRWNPKTLIKRIQQIYQLAPRIAVSCIDAVEFIEQHFWDNQSTIFVDPPYVEKGQALYTHYYTEKDHLELAFVLRSLHYGTPCADILVTYDYNEWINDVYYATDSTEIISRCYSI